MFAPLGIVLGPELGISTKGDKGNLHWTPGAGASGHIQ